MKERTGQVTRQTKETQITIEINLDEESESEVATGIGFLDHTLNLFAKHGRFGLKVQANGDLEVDPHHTTEDVSIVLGECFRQALGEKIGIERYGSSLIPMDETLGRVVVDLSGRPYLVFKAELENPRLGTFETETVEDFSKDLLLRPCSIYTLRSSMGAIRTIRSKHFSKSWAGRCG